MGDENIVLYDETSPLEQSRRDILHYRSRSEEAPTYLVELPESHVDAPRPSTQLRARSRRSTIVNTLHLPDTREAEEQPLEDYVRRNLPSFRKSLTPEDLQRKADQGGHTREEVVSPATAEDIERDLMDNKKRKNRETDSVESYGGRESFPKESTRKHRTTYQSEEKSPQPKTHKNKDTPKSTKAEKTKDSYYDKPSANQNEHSLPRNEVVAMPALEPVSVTHNSPFSEDRRSPSSKDRSYPPIKVKVSVESSDEEHLGVDGREGKHCFSKTGKSNPSSAKRIPRDDSMEEYDVRVRKKPTKPYYFLKSRHRDEDSDEAKDGNVKNRRRIRRKEKSEESKRRREKSKESTDRSSDDEKRRRKSFDKAARSRSSSVCLSTESGDNNSEPNIVNSPPKREKRAANDKRSSPSSKDRTAGEQSSSRNEKRSSQSSAKRERKSEDFVDYSQTKNPFGKEEPYSVHYVATKGATGKKTKKGKDSKERKGVEEANKKIPVKAPRSATKVVAKRRYHIQIPEHDRPETWFSVRFNMNSENNVDMNYVGPVKINNYYASNNYT